MFNTLFASTLIDMIELLKSTENFFDLNEKERSHSLEKHAFSPALKDYFLKIRKEMMLSDLEELSRNLLSSQFKQNRSMGLKMIEFLSSYFDVQLDIDIEKQVTEGEKGHYLLVQSPIKLDSETREQIRAKLTIDYPEATPVFVINKDLIGGLRIFINGQTIDLSWISKINQLTQLLA